ncbi:MAG: phage major capsid protein [Pseudomonadota bacterium]
MILQQYYEERGTLVAEARSILDSIGNETDQTRITEAEQRHDAVIAKLDALDKKIQREERQLQAEKAEEERRKQNRPNRGSGSASGVDDPEDGEQRTAEQAQEEYREAFYAMLREGGDMSILSPEQRQLLRRGYVENRVQTAGTDAAGGFTVPTTLANFIVSSMKDFGPMYDPGITTELVTSSGNAFDIPTNDDTSNTAALLAEGADLTDDNSGDLAFGEKNLNAYVYATPWLKISFELLQDSAFNLEAFIGAKLGERLGRIANQRLTIGTGSSQPNGIVTAATIGRTAAAAAAIAADELIDLQHSVNAAYRRSPRCGWMFADTTLASIRKLKDGQGNYLWQMGDVRVGAPDLILGKQYYVNDDVAAMAANARSVVFGDMGAYIVRKVGSPLIGTVRERFWPKVGMAGLVRFDGELTDTAAVKVLRQAAS